MTRHLIFPVKGKKAPLSKKYVQYCCCPPDIVAPRKMKNSFPNFNWKTSPIESPASSLRQNASGALSYNYFFKWYDEMMYEAIKQKKYHHIAETKHVCAVNDNVVLSVTHSKVTWTNMRCINHYENFIITMDRNSL